MKKIFQFILLSFYIIAVGIPVVAQKKITCQDMIWLRYSGKLNLPQNWVINTEVEDRRFAFPDRQQYWLLPRVTVSKPLGDNWSAGAGFLYYLSNSPASPKAATILTIPELRPFEELAYKQTIKKLAINHRYWLEERFIHKNDGKHLQRGYNFNFCFRYRLQLQYPLIRSEDLKVVIADEIFLNLGHSIVRNTFDQNRIYAGLNYALSKYVQLEADYINQFQEKSNGDDYTAQDILRLTFFHTINLH